jgi:hypothetical protein
MFYFKDFFLQSEKAAIFLYILCSPCVEKNQDFNAEVTEAAEEEKIR